MSRRILMATVAALALAAPAVAQEQPKPIQNEQQANQPAQAPDEVARDESVPDDAATGGAAGDAVQPPAMAGDQSAGVAPAEEAAAEQAAPPPDMKFLNVQEEAQFLADDEVIGKAVVNPSDEEVGTIADLVMDQEQKLVGVVLSVGGFLGIGDKWVAVPVDQIDFPADDQPARLRVAVTEAQLQNAPDFMTRDALAAEQAQQQVQQEAMDQQQQIPSPTPGNQ